ncbi:ParB N-terminal domain-containing protein [Candidatus Nitrosopumilus sediminis]|uniref:ParB/Sulfiredoxin domain-containing protein n=1 Tax=Candidatus Nitrosopumilus sediminis TaxID=1229909 RepID=K0BAQ7_9ARCH|nr:ParB N-terminal domain-containing protein [Candidatus Nitrosopumilus sediminis]AFS82569.1 hypothetical protein NSED_03815 [Candidatus Nitrosopumilus sediminis]
MSSEEFQPYLYLYAAMTQPEVTGIVRTYCSPGEISDLSNTLTSWQQARSSLEQIQTQENEVANNMTIFPIEQNEKLTTLQNSPLFPRTFSNMPSVFGLVDIDTLVATQRNVYLNYVNEMEQRIPDNPSIDDLIDICLPLNPSPPEPKVTQTSQSSWIFSSPSPDFRYLGGHLKDQISEDDIGMTQVGGFPVKAITLFVGYGTSPINVYHANGRLILNNGFHRVYALRRRGITRIPVVVQQVSNPELEFPQQLLGLTRNYLLNNPRPILVKDFFTDGLTKTFQRKKMITTVQVNAQAGAVTFEV